MSVAYKNRKTVENYLTVQDILDYVKENNLDPKTTELKFFEADCYFEKTYGLDSIAVDEDKYNKNPAILISTDSVFNDWEYEE